MNFTKEQINKIARWAHQAHMSGQVQIFNSNYSLEEITQELQDNESALEMYVDYYYPATKDLMLNIPTLEVSEETLNDEHVLTQHFGNDLSIYSLNDFIFEYCPEIDNAVILENNGSRIVVVSDAGDGSATLYEEIKNIGK